MNSRRVTAAYIQSPFQVTYRSIDLRPPGPGEILLDVLATGICGHDMEIAASLAPEPKPFGHEIAGRVREAGPGVTHVREGDLIALESSAFCGQCSDCRNGRVDLCRHTIAFGGEPAMGFAEAMVAPARVAVPAPDLDPAVAALAEPLGVALDMLRLAEIGLTDRVLLVGAGPIGLMALALARRQTTAALVAVSRSPGRLAAARRLGADAAVSPEEVSLGDLGKRYGGFNRVLVTAPPQTLPGALDAAAYEGYVVFIGFDWGAGGTVPIDTTAMHLGKKQLRASFASPAVFLPRALQLLQSGAVPAGDIITHRLPLQRLGEALRMVREQRDTVLKVIITPQ